MTLEQLMNQYFFRVYGRRNRVRWPSLMNRVAFLARGLSRLEDAHRENLDKKALGNALARVVGRTMCVVEHFQGPYSVLDLVFALATKFHVDGCPYCKHASCMCPDSGRSAATIRSMTGSGQRDWSLRDWQIHFKSIYSIRNRDKGFGWIINRLSKEIRELMELVQSTPRCDDPPGTIENRYAYELADTLAWTIAVANFLSINLQEAVDKKYGNGCKKCESVRGEECTCGAPNLSQERWREEAVSE